jgi:hypothetical protein
MSFSMLILAIGLGYTAHQRGQRGELTTAAQFGLYAVAATCFIVFLAGVKQRHRPDDEPPDDHQNDR